MSGFKEFAHEIRKRDTHYSSATGQHVAVYALDNNRVYIIDENGGLADFQIKDGFFNNVQISGNCRIIGQDVVTDTVIDGYDLIFNLDESEVTGNMSDANPSGADWRMDVYSISGVSNGFNQLRVFDNNEEKTCISVRKGGNVIIGNYAETIDDDGVHTIQLSGSMIIHGNLDIDGDHWIDGDLYVTGNVDITGNTVHHGGISSQRGAGLYNEAYGVDALGNVTTGVNNTAIGYESLRDTATGYNNTSVGQQSLMLNTVGDGNVAVGRQALMNNTNGVANTAVGTFSLNVATSGSQNVFIGGWSGVTKVDGSSNVAIGYASLGNNEYGSGNVAIGHNAGYNETGSNKLYIANSAGTSADALIYGEFDTENVWINGNLYAGIATFTSTLNITSPDKTPKLQVSAADSSDVIVSSSNVSMILRGGGAGSGATEIALQNNLGIILDPYNGKVTVDGFLLESVQSLSFADAGTTTAVAANLFNKNTSTIASHTINFPSTPGDGQKFVFATRGAITTLSWGGGTANSTPASVSANDRFTWVYNTDDSIWMRTA